MIATDVKMGAPLEFQIEREGYVYRLVSKVEGNAYNKIYVSLIATATRVFKFREEDTVNVIYRSGERLWIWKNVSGEVELLDGERVHAITVKGEAESYNRRNAYRVPVGDIFTFTKTMYENVTGEMVACVPTQTFDAMIKDISENGVGIVSKAQLNVGDVFEFQFAAGGQNMDCQAKVVRIMKIPEEASKQLYGCMLTKSGKALAKYVIEAQRKQLKNLRGGN